MASPILKPIKTMEMNETKFNELLQEIETNYTKAKNQLYVDYAASQRKFKIGDVIRDKRGVLIEVRKFGTWSLKNTAKPYYTGIALRKDLQPKKNGDVDTIFGNDDVELVRPATQE